MSDAAIEKTISTAAPSRHLVSLTGAQWQLREADMRLAAAIARTHEVPEVVARLLSARGVTPENAAHFLAPTLKHSLPDPSHLLDMDAAAERVAAAVVQGECVAVFGDYDVDGATSSALLLRYFRLLGVRALVHIPERQTEGYGPNAPALLSLKAQGASLILTVDCGTLSFAPLEEAYAAGIDVIVIDHHQGEARKPKAFAIVNPNRLDETSTHRHLAAVGVAFLLVVAVNRCLRKLGFFALQKEPDLRTLLDLVALGTVCDVVSLTGVNRAFVAQGLQVMAARQNVGLRTLMDKAGLDEPPSAYTLGFVIGPRINAGGRVGKSDLGVRLLATEDELEAKHIAAELERFNAERKTIEQLVLEQALQKAEASANAPVLVLAGEGWHAGVIGIVAGRVKEQFNKPTCIIGLSGDVGKASARSAHGFDVGAAVIAAVEAGLLVAGGGHAAAAGFTVKAEKIAEFSAFLCDRYVRTTLEEARTRALSLDAVLSLSGASLSLAETISQLGPFGQGNPTPKLWLRAVKNLKPEPVGDAHVKTLLIDPVGSARLSAMAFRAQQSKLGEALFATRGQTIDVAGTLRAQQWQGAMRLSFLIEDIAACS